MNLPPESPLFLRFFAYLCKKYDKMKRTVIALLLSVVTLVAAGQGRITTKRYRISDFTTKVTKVVMTGNDIMDGALKQEVLEHWRISPFEFCSLSEFETLKKSANYYFLLVASSDVSYLTVVKGGSTEGLGSEEVSAIPIGPGGIAMGRETIFLSAFLEITQDYILRAMESEKDSYTGFTIYNSNYRKDGRRKRICFCEDDLSADGAAIKRYMDADMFVRSEEEANRLYLEGSYNTLVSYVVAPAFPKAGDTCYKMLIDAASDRLYYYKKHKLKEGEVPGFRNSDLKSLSVAR